MELTANTHNYGSTSIDKDIYIEGEEIKLIATPNNLNGNSITNYISDSIGFWKEKLKFDELIWNFNNVDFYNNVHPTLIWISNN